MLLIILHSDTIFQRRFRRVCTQRILLAHAPLLGDTPSAVEGFAYRSWLMLHLIRIGQVSVTIPNYFSITDRHWTVIAT